MAFNNTVILEGNPTSEPTLVQDKDRLFLAFTIATQDSYTDKDNNWQKRKPDFHDVYVFKPHLIDLMEGVSTKERLKVTGRISYQPIEAFDSEGKKLFLKKTSIIAGMVEPAPLGEVKEEAKQPS